MLITQKFSLLRILRFTWKLDLIMMATCAATYYTHVHIARSATEIPPAIATLLGTAIAFFIGFNNNQAYNRWWEARMIWGALINDSRTWARNVIHFTTEGNLNSNELTAIKRQMIYRHISFVYALKNNLRKTDDPYYKKYLHGREDVSVTQQSNVPNAILTLNAIDLQRLSENRAVGELRFMQLNEMITSFTDHLGKCERIKNTVFPTPYVYFTSLFIWVFVIFCTLMLSELVSVWSVLIGWIVGFVFHVSHKNGMSLMNPFEETPSGIPLNQMARTIEINLLEMLGEKEIPQPVQPVKNEYIM